MWFYWIMNSSKTKIITLLFAMLLAMTVLFAAACNTSDPVSDESESTVGEETTSTPEETAAPEPVSLIPEGFDFRKTVSDYMRKMGLVEWKAKETADYSSEWDITKGLIYEGGKTYRGMPYANQQCGFEIFAAHLDENNVYIGSTVFDDCYGNTCTTSIKNAWYLVSNTINFRYAIDMFPYPDKDTGVLPLGNIPWGEYDGKNTSLSVKKKTDKTTVYEAYSLLQLGDAVVYYHDNNGHGRMVTGEVKTARNADGTINGDRSFVTLTDQTSHFIKNSDSPLPTHWNVDRKFSFADLYVGGYLPVTIKELQEGKAEEPAFKILNKPLAKTFTGSKTFRGTVESNFKIILATSTLTDDSGNVLFTHTATPEGMSYDMTEPNSLFDLKTLGAGSYTFSVKATIGFGEFEVYSLTFEL